MTAHPKYYSFVGLVAPEDRKAVYMGYAFLYGVIGSLIGANVGALLYTKLMTPAIHTPMAAERARLFWLMFAALDVVGAIGLIAFARAYGKDTPEARLGARRIMHGVYLSVLALGTYYCYEALSATPLNSRMAVQATIFLLLGSGGFVMNWRRGQIDRR